jgi:hypothetical protein
LDFIEASALAETAATFNPIWGAAFPVRNGYVDSYRQLAAEVVGAGSVIAGVGSLLGGSGLREAGQVASSALRREAGDIAGGRITSGLLKPCNSFVAGTGVVMADGSVKAIEDVKVGDKTDPTTGKTTSEAVTDTIAGTGEKHLVRISIDVDGKRGGKTGALTATDHHPFCKLDPSGPRS